MLAAISIAAVARAASADDLTADLRARRARLLEALGADAVFVAFSAPVRIYSRDIAYEYRQDSNLYYLTGIDQPGTTLVLLPRNSARTELLFIAPRDLAQEHREGRRLSTDAASARSGIDGVYLATEFDTFIDAILTGKDFDGVRTERPVLALIEDSEDPPEYAEDPTRVFAATMLERFPDVSQQNVHDALSSLRRIKTSYEQNVLRASVNVSSEAHRAGMRTARPGAFEYEVEAAIEQVFLGRGGLGWSYPSIVGSGPNATILHYERSRRQMAEGDLLLVDAAANYEYLTGDITRTYPVNGTFSDAQRELYDLVLSAQQAAMGLASPSTSLSDLNREAARVMKDGLLRLGLITDTEGDEYRVWATHGSCHYIGMDVHDVGDNDDPLVPGVSFVIEPGLYIRPEALEQLPESDDTRAFVAATRAAVERYGTVGIRIEDSFLMTDDGLERLSVGVPRTVDELERFMAAR